MRKYSLSPLTLLLVSASFSGSVSAQELPGIEALSNRLAQELPGYWQVDDLTVIAQASEGDIRSPTAVIRYEARVQNLAPLFKVSDQTMAPFVVVVPTVDQNSNRTLYGIMELGYSAGVWSGSVKIENPVTGLGQPADLFENPVVVLGSERQKQLATILASSQMEALANELQDKVISLTLQQERESALLEAQYRQRRAEIEQRQAQEIEELRSGNPAELQQLRAQAEARRQELQKGYQEELSNLMAANARNIAETRARQAAQIRELEVGFNARIDSLKRQISSSQELNNLQEQFMRILETQSQNYSRIVELHANAVLKRAQTMQSYLGQWTGAVTCRSSQNQIRFVADKVEGQSVSGTIIYDLESSYPAVLNVLNLDLSLPTGVTLIPIGNNDPWTYTAEIDRDGVLRGTRVNNSRCVIVLSQ